jgi:hypothetical protein
MKTKSLMFLLILLGFSFFLNAQFSPGIKGGVNFANLNGYNGDSRISLHAGLFLHHSINNRWCFQPELLYSGEGQHYFNSDGEERILASDYVQVPLMVQYYASRQLYFEAGPQVGLLVSARDYPVGNGIKLNVKNDFRPAQFGINVGAGVQVNPTLGFYGRYTFGVTDVGRYDYIIDQSRVGQLGLSIRLK